MKILPEGSPADGCAAEGDCGVPAKRVDILLKDLRTPDSPIAPLVYGYDSRFNDLVDGDDFYIEPTSTRRTTAF